MNIFILDTNPRLAAKYRCKKHNPKMLIESLQLLSTYIKESNNINKYTFLDKPIKQGKELVNWLQKDINNLNWFKLFIQELFKLWIKYSKNKAIKETALYNKYILFLEHNLLDVDYNNITPKSFIFRCQEEYIINDLQHKQECFDIHRIVANYRDFYTWKLERQNMCNFYEGVPYWIDLEYILN